jgi:hypothetical protein
MTTLSLTLASTRVNGDRIALVKNKRLDGVVTGYAVIRNGAEKSETLFRGISELSARMWFDHFAK